MGVAYRLGSSLGVGEDLAKVPQKVSALDRPGQKKFGVRASFFLSSFSLIELDKYLLH